MTEQKYYETEKGAIAYQRSRAKGKALTLVFLPGLTADRRLFERQMDFFEGRRDFLVWDAPGHGDSRPFTLDFSLMDKAAWLKGILDSEEIKAPVLVGQSMGGYVSQCFMERFPGHARGFISIDSAPLQRKYVSSAEIWMLRHCEGIYKVYPWKALLKSGSEGCSETEYGRELMKAMMNGYGREEYAALAGHGYRMLADAIAADLPYEIDCPALLLCGERDRAGSTKHYNRRWADETGLPLVWIKGAGHNSTCDRPEEVNLLIEEFLEKLEC